VSARQPVGTPGRSDAGWTPAHRVRYGDAEEDATVGAERDGASPADPGTGADGPNHAEPPPGVRSGEIRVRLPTPTRTPNESGSCSATSLPPLAEGNDDWATYDRVMREERRTAVLVTPTRLHSGIERPPAELTSVKSGAVHPEQSRRSRRPEQRKESTQERGPRQPRGGTATEPGELPRLAKAVQNDGSRVPRTPRKTRRSPYRTPTAFHQLSCSGSSCPATVSANLGETFVVASSYPRRRLCRRSRDGALSRP
jgi:hypothetical protein